MSLSHLQVRNEIYKKREINFDDMRLTTVKCAKFNNCKLTARLLLHFMRIVQFHVNNKAVL